MNYVSGDIKYCENTKWVTLMLLTLSYISAVLASLDSKHIVTNVVQFIEIEFVIEIVENAVSVWLK